MINMNIIGVMFSNLKHLTKYIVYFLVLFLYSCNSNEINGISGDDLVGNYNCKARLLDIQTRDTFFAYTYKNIFTNDGKLVSIYNHIQRTDTLNWYLNGYSKKFYTEKPHTFFDQFIYDIKIWECDYKTYTGESFIRVSESLSKKFIQEVEMTRE